MAGLTKIPARVLDAVTAKDEILALQLTENLQREDLDPIDTALAMVGYFQSRHAEKGFDVANLGHPNLPEIFQEAIGEEGFTNARSGEGTEEGEEAGNGRCAETSLPLHRRSVRSVKSGIEEQVAAFKKSDLEALLTGLREFVALVEGRFPEALDDGVPVAKARLKPKKKKRNPA
jgi:ParB-like chromosome segregation protein Spo0J